MGSRLAAVVKTAGRFECFYDHWAAEGIEFALIADGVDGTIDRVRRMKAVDPVTEPVQLYLTGGWEDGALLIDCDDQLVVWWGEWTHHLPRIANRLIEATWPGWRAVWAAEGTLGITALLGIDDTQLRARAFDGDSEPCEIASDRLDPGHEFADEIVASVRLRDGRTLAWQVWGDLQDIAACGPAAIMSTARRALDHGLVGTAWQRGWRLLDERGQNDSPRAGMHVDETTRTIGWWSCSDEQWHLGAFRSLWKGYTVQCWGDAFERQQAATHCPDLTPPQLLMLSEYRDDLVAVAGSLRTNPMDRLAAVMRDRGEAIDVNPATGEFVPSGSQAAVTALRTLDELLADDQLLPPAVFLDHEGRIQ